MIVNILKDQDDARAVHLLSPNESRELCGIAGDWATSNALEVTCRECINEMIYSNWALPPCPR